MRSLVRSSWLAIVLVVLALGPNSTAAIQSTCAGSGAQASNDEGSWHGYVLLCSGTCGTGQSCSSQSGSDAIGDFHYCGCYSGDTDACCTVVLRPDGPSKFGSCPPCGTTGTCGITGAQGGYEPRCSTGHEPK